MKFELCNTEISHFASQETYCFNAILIVDGQPLCEVSNGGYGGPNNYESIRPNDTYKELTRKLKDIDKKLNKEILDCGSFTIPNCLEIVIGDLLNEHVFGKA